MKISKIEFVKMLRRFAPDISLSEAVKFYDAFEGAYAYAGCYDSYGLTLLMAYFSLIASKKIVVSTDGYLYPSLPCPIDGNSLKIMIYENCIKGEGE